MRFRLEKLSAASGAASDKTADETTDLIIPPASATADKTHKTRAQSTHTYLLYKEALVLLSAA